MFGFWQIELKIAKLLIIQLLTVLLFIYFIYLQPLEGKSLKSTSSVLEHNCINYIFLYLYFVKLLVQFTVCLQKDEAYNNYQYVYFVIRALVR
jgi:hypothetical protein